jgi:uncharacterized protein
MRLILVTLAMTSCLADKLLLWPQKSRSADAADIVEIDRPDGKLEIIVARSTPDVEPTAFVLRFYGNGELANDIAYEARGMQGQRLEWWGVNYPGYGNSAGPATLGRLAKAARDAYAAIAKRANGRPIIVIGNSMGGAAALHVAANERVAGVVLHNPVPLRQLILRRHGWYNLWFVAIPVAAQIPDELDSIGNAARVRAPALLLSSAKDIVVPPYYQDRIMKAYAGAWRTLAMRGAGHNDPLPAWVQRELADQLAAWSR